MKFLLIIATLLATTISFAQTNHCVQDRYAQTAVFDSADIETTLYTYAIEETWPSTSMDTLDIEVYKPYDIIDPIEKRPFVLMIHGGGFFTGTKTDMSYFSMEMARRGFVSGTIDYRLGWDCNPGSLAAVCIDCGNEAAKLRVAAYRAVQDARAAIRYVIDNADALGVDTAQIFLQGTSAGSITALHTAFWDQAEADAFCPTCDNELGSLDNAGISPQQPFTIKGVINNCGSISSLAVMDNASIPVIGFHDEWDCTVPYQGGNVFGCLGCTAFYYSNGSDAIRSKLNSEGVCYSLNTVPLTLNHCSYPNNAIIGKATCFIKSILCDQCTSYTTTSIWDIPDCMTGTTSVNLSELASDGISVFPNPVSDVLHISAENEFISHITIQGMDGRKLSSIPENKQLLDIDVSNLDNGIYVVEITTENGKKVIRRLVKN